VVAPRDTFTGVGVGRKACSETGEAIRWGHFFSWRGGGHLFDVGPASTPLSEPINQLDAVLGTWGRESRLPLSHSPGFIRSNGLPMTSEHPGWLRRRLGPHLPDAYKRPASSARDPARSESLATARPVLARDVGNERAGARSA
jgi:hypothetical protein